jgi:flagellar hook protein FlgE
MIDFSAPLAGMQQAEAKFNTSARQIAQTAGPQADSVDLSAEAVNLLQAKNSFAANAKAVSVTDQMTKSVLDMMG